jgi:hypothetical protein
MYTAIGNYYSFYDCLLSCPTSTTDSVHTVVPPDDGPRYARNMWMLKKYTKL